MSVKTTIKLKFYFTPNGCDERHYEHCHELEILDNKIRVCFDTTNFFDNINAASRAISDFCNDPRHNIEDEYDIHSEIEIFQHNDNGTNKKVVYQLTEIFDDDAGDDCLRYNMTNSNWDLDCYSELTFSCNSMIPAIMDLLNDIGDSNCRGTCFNYNVW